MKQQTTQEMAMALDLDAIRQAIEERDAAIQACEDLANRMEYHGNSISWIHSKAEKYKRALEDAWSALNEAGIIADGQKDVAAGIRELAARAAVSAD